VKRVVIGRGQMPTFVQFAAKGSFEPRVLDAALIANVS
jgi:hypothetical protein